jgi:hypothetical protein
VSGNFGALGICDPSSTANDFYYGIAVHHERGEIWVCNVLRNRIDVLDFEGNCLYQLHGQSSQLPPSLRFPPLREGNQATRPLGSPCGQGEPEGGGPYFSLIFANCGSAIGIIPIARSEFTIAPLLEVPPASRGEPRRGSVPPARMGNLKEGVYTLTYFCKLWLRDWYE